MLIFGDMVVEFLLNLHIVHLMIKKSLNGHQQVIGPTGEVLESSEDVVTTETDAADYDNVCNTNEYS